MPKHQIIIFDKRTGRLLRRVRQGKNIRVRIKPLSSDEGVMRAPLHITLQGHQIVAGKLTRRNREREPEQQQQIQIGPKDKKQ